MERRERRPKTLTARRWRRLAAAVVIVVGPAMSGAGGATRAAPAGSGEATSAAVTPAAGPPHPVGVFPLDEVRPGLTGVARTVFEGEQIEQFGVEILGVYEDFAGPGQDVILARLTGDKVQHTGVVAGMSGSPVYVDGRLLGAASDRLG